jgi:DNA-binding GntR family transcriptional regulator
MLASQLPRVAIAKSVIWEETPNVNGTQQKMLSFESERSLGPTGDSLFLEIRHKILTAQFAPMQLIVASNLAMAAGVPKSLALAVFEALSDHGYLTMQTSDSATIVHWSNRQFSDLIDACQDLTGLAIDKCMSRIDAEGLSRLREALDFNFFDPITADQLETFQIRWWIFFQTIISTIEVRNFRKMMLTGMPPALRRRVITSLDGPRLRCMLDDMKALISAFEGRDPKIGREILVHQFSSFTPHVIAANQCFNELACEDEVDYSPKAPLTKPLFRPGNSSLPPFHQGLREPLSWAEFKALPALF